MARCGGSNGPSGDPYPLGGCFPQAAAASDREPGKRRCPFNLSKTCFRQSVVASSRRRRSDGQDQAPLVRSRSFWAEPGYCERETTSPPGWPVSKSELRAGSTSRAFEARPPWASPCPDGRSGPSRLSPACATEQPACAGRATSLRARRLAEGYNGRPCAAAL